MAREGCARQHLPGKHCTYRMGNGVVHVEQIEIIDLRNFRHPRRQRKIVWRVLEQRILGDRNFVIPDIVVERSQAEGLRVRDEVNLMPTMGELNSQFGGDHSAAAVRGITRDSDLHAVSAGYPGLDVWCRTAPQKLWIKGREFTR